ncbi:hypothetical protein [Actinophytocola sp.]|uniref:hypothetical protein n=1 Tax=Actinophytocola sp. TaxID=1872138 RepID=UPI002ED0C9A5
MRRPRLAVHRSVLVVDVEGYGQEWRTTPHRLAVREGLERSLRRAFDDTGLPWADCRVEDCGDGAFVLVPAQVPKGLLIETLPYALADALRQHNKTHEAQPVKIALRRSPGVLVVVTSEWFFDEVVRQSCAIDPATFRPVWIAVKETVTTGWIFRPDHPSPAENRVVAAS